MRVAATDAEVGIYSFGRISKGTKPMVCYTIDVSGLRDPQANRSFKNTYPDGRAGEIQSYVAEDPRVAAIIEQVQLLSHMHLRSAKDGRWLSFAMRDHHGRWTAPAVAELVTDALANSGFKVNLVHMDLEVRA